jgi:hypothetical protein
MKALKDSDKDRHEQLCTELALGRQVRRPGRAGQPDRAEDRGQSTAGRRVRLLAILRRTPTRVQGLDDERRRADLREHRDRSSIRERARSSSYVKNAHLDAIRGLREFVAEWASSWGRDGPLTAIGLVAIPTTSPARSRPPRPRSPAQRVRAEVKAPPARCRLPSCFLLALGLGLAGWLAARARAWSFRRAATERGSRRFRRYHAWYVALWIAVPVLLFVIAVSADRAGARRAVGARVAGRRGLPAFGFQRETISAKRRNVATGRRQRCSIRRRVTSSSRTARRSAATT